MMIVLVYFYDGEVGLSSVGSAIYCVGAHVLFRPGEVGLQLYWGLVPLSRLDRDRYRQVHTDTIVGGK